MRNVKLFVSASKGAYKILKELKMVLKECRFSEIVN